MISAVDRFRAVVSDTEIKYRPVELYSPQWAVCFGTAYLRQDEHPKIRTGSHLITICQKRPGKNFVWKLPPGRLSRGESPEDTTEQRAQERYLVETGFEGDNWKPLGRVMRANVNDDRPKYTQLYMAQGLKFQPQQKRSNQLLVMIPVPVQEIMAILTSGMFVEPNSVACTYLALYRLGILKWTRS